MKHSHIFSLAAISIFFIFVPTIAMEPGMRRDSRPLTKQQIKQGSKISNLNPITRRDTQTLFQQINQPTNMVKRNRRVPQDHLDEPSQDAGSQ